MWSSVGTFTYVNAVLFKLQDKTSDSGVHWDSRDSIVPLPYPDAYSGDLGWLNFKGLWGNKGTTSCWWHSIYSECEIIDGPDGPVRDDVLSVKRDVIAPNMNAAMSKFTMTGPLSVRPHPRSALTAPHSPRTSTSPAHHSKPSRPSHRPPAPRPTVSASASRPHPHRAPSSPPSSSAAARPTAPRTNN